MSAEGRDELSGFLKHGSSPGRIVQHLSQGFSSPNQAASLAPLMYPSMSAAQPELAHALSRLHGNHMQMLGSTAEDGGLHRQASGRGDAPLPKLSHGNLLQAGDDAIVQLAGKALSTLVLASLR